MQYKTGFKVMDDKGREYSKRPMSEKRAKAQMRALYAAEKDGILRHVKGGNIELYNPHTKEKVLIGSGFFGNIWTKIKEITRQGIQKAKTIAKSAAVPILNVVSDVTSLGLRNNYPPKVRETLAKYGNGLIQKMTVRRIPIEGYVEKAMSFMSRGQWETMKQKLNYDKIFHLQLIAFVSVLSEEGVPNQLVPFLIEKNEVIVVAPLTGESTAKVDMNNPNAETIDVPMSSAISLQQLMDKAQQMVGPSFFTYDAFTNNCQIFINNILNANGLNNTDIRNFIMQDTAQIVQELPKYVKPVSRIITNIAGIADRIIQGEGQDELYDMLDNESIGSMDESKCNMKVAVVAIKPNTKRKGKKKVIQGSGFFGDLWDWLGGQQKEINVRETIGDAPNAKEYGLRPIEDIANEKTSNMWKDYNEKQKAIKLSREDLSKLEGELYNRASKRNNARVQKYMNEGMSWSNAMNKAQREPFYTQEEDCQIYNAKGITPAYCEQYTGVKSFSQPNYTLDDMNKDGKENWNNFVKTENGQLYQQHAAQYDDARKQIDAENSRIRDCNNSFGCAFKNALGNVSGALSFIPGPLGAIGNAVSTGLDVVNTFTGEGTNGYELHAVIVKKPIDLSAARKISRKFIKGNKKFVRETEDSYRFRNVPKQKFESKSFRTKVVNDGISLVYGKLKSTGGASCMKGGAFDFASVFNTLAGQLGTASDIVSNIAPGSSMADALAAATAANELRMATGQILGNRLNQYAPGALGRNSPAGAVLSKWFGVGKGIHAKFAKQLADVGLTQEAYLKTARAAAKANGYDQRALEFSDDGKTKLMIYDDKGKVHRFGRVGYGDFIIWSHMDKKKAQQKRNTFHKSHSKLPGDWKADKYSPNNLALSILW